MTTIDRDSPVPLYFQLKQILLDQIIANRWKAGQVIPSEQELGETYGVSRITVRQTLSELVTEGYLIRQRGRGTFIAKPKITYTPSSKIELNEMMRQQGVTLGWRLLALQETAVAIPPEVVAAFGGRKTAPNLIAIRRLRLAGDKPIGYHFAYLPERCGRFINQAALEVGESLDYLNGLPELAKARLERTLEARPAGALEVQHLGVAVGAPILYLERTVVAESGIVVEFLQAAFRGDRFKYRISM